MSRIFIKLYTVYERLTYFTSYARLCLVFPVSAFLCLSNARGQHLTWKFPTEST